MWTIELTNINISIIRVKKIGAILIEVNVAKAYDMGNIEVLWPIISKVWKRNILKVLLGD